MNGSKVCGDETKMTSSSVKEKVFLFFSKNKEKYNYYLITETKRPIYVTVTTNAYLRLVIFGIKHLYVTPTILLSPHDPEVDA